MLANRTLLEVVRQLEVRQVLECREVCRKWRDVCGKEEVWVVLGEEFTEDLFPGESKRQWFLRCYRRKSTLVRLFHSHIRLFNCLTSTLRDVQLPKALSTTEATYCLFSYDGSLIVTGGGSLTAPSASIIQIALNGTYQCLGRLIEPRRNHGAVLFQGCVYLFGGMGNNLTPLASAEKLDVKSGAIEELPSSTTSRFCFTPACDLETIYLSGGWSDALMELYHPQSKDYFQPKLDFSPSPQRSVSVLKGESLYVIYAQGACCVDLRRLASVWKSAITLPPGEVAISPLLFEATVWLFLENQPVAILLID